MRSLEQLIWSERLRLAPRIALVALFALGLAALIYADVPENAREIVGTITGLDADSSDYGIWHYAVVHLDGGRIVQARVDSIGSLKNGDRVVIVESTGRLFHWRTYRIIRRLEPSPRAR
jgi:hypothetical protein